MGSIGYHATMMEELEHKGLKKGGIYHVMDREPWAGGM